MLQGMMEKAELFLVGHNHQIHEKDDIWEND
jgi:hypothetical protein